MKYQGAEDSKPFWQSKTVVGIGVVLLGALGADVAGIEHELTAVVEHAAIAFGAILALYGRAVASDRITLK